MKWQKLGQIFDFKSSPFVEDFVSHAQSPQALVLKDRIRVFFSTRQVDQDGKYISHVRYVDYDFGFEKIIDYSKHEVIALGRLGCFDEHGIFPLSPVRVGEKIYGYTNGISRRTSVDVESGIGFATSHDNGRTFQKLGDGPLLSSALHEPFLVGDAFVREFQGAFHMFYLFGKKWSEAAKDHAAERVYKIAQAISTDGLNWQRDSQFIIADKLGEDECQALPTVLQVGKRYHMYFCYRAMIGFRSDKNKSYRLGYAYSDDLLHWTRNDAKAGLNLSGSGWDSEMMCYPNIFKCKKDIYLLYNGNYFGREGFGIAKLLSD